VRLALRELRRRPGRFAVATVILTLIALLLMFLGGLLDGLLAASTGAYRAQDADLIVYSADARESLVRSRITAAQRDAVEDADGVGSVGGLGSVQLGARQGDPMARDLLATVLFGYELAPDGLPDDPPAAGTVIADASLEADGVEEGTTLLLGPDRSPVEVVGFADDTRYSGQGSLWGSLDTWREVTQANRPGEVLDDGVVQALVVRTAGAAPAGTVADSVEAATDDTTTALTLSAAIEALPGVSQQRTTFNQIIGVTLVIGLVVVGLFFALITVERTALYGILKAVGASSATLFAGVVTQAVAVTLVASAVGVGASLVLDAAIPPGAIPYLATPTRLAASAALLVLAAVVGAAFSLRRVLRVDPASAIGTAS
jgi:putative ABC transport system permease protein